MHRRALFLENNVWARVDMKCRVEHSKSDLVLFCLSYKHNSALVTRKADVNNKRKEIEESTIVQCFGAKAQDGKML